MHKYLFILSCAMGCANPAPVRCTAGSEAGAGGVGEGQLLPPFKCNTLMHSRPHLQRRFAPVPKLM